MMGFNEKLQRHVLKVMVDRHSYLFDKLEHHTVNDGPSEGLRADLRLTKQVIDLILGEREAFLDEYDENTRKYKSVMEYIRDQVSQS